MPRTALVLAALLSSGTAFAQTPPADDEVPASPPPAPPPPSTWGAPPSQPAAGDGERVPLAYAALPMPTARPGLMGVPEIVSLYATGSLWGTGFGVWLAGTAIRDRAGAHTVILPLLGLGGGIAAAALIQRNGEVRRGRALAVHAGMWLGLTAGIGLTGAAEWKFNRDGLNLGSHALFGGATLGMIAGAGVAALTDARPGSVGFTFSMGLWTAYAGAMIESAARTMGRDRFPAAGILIGEGVGIATGMILSSMLEPTAAQARWMDLGGLCGASAGLLAGAAVKRADAAPFLGSLGGMLTGVLLGYFLGAPSEEDRQRNRERDGVRGVRPSAFVAPVEGGAVMGLSLL